MTVHVVELAETADIRNVSALAEQLSTLSEAPEPVRLVATEVGRVDASALQLLAAFARERQAAGRETHWDVSATVDDSARLLGLQATLGLPPAQTSESS